MTRAAALIMALGLFACAAPRPFEPHPAAPEMRAEMHRDGPVAVMAAALGAAESRERFGVSLHDAGVQPVWLRIVNDDRTHYWLLPTSIDWDYFLPSEAVRRAAGRRASEDLVARVRSAALPVFIPPRSEVSGVIFTRVDEGLKALTVQLVGPGVRRDFPMVLPVPGLRRPPIASRERIYPRQELPDLRDDAGLLDFVAQLPCCATGPEGQPADPLNFVIVGPLSMVRLALASRGWALAEVVSPSASWGMTSAFLFGQRAPHGAVSDLRLFGRAQDLALQKAREVVAERNHLRLWLAPVTWRGQPVVVGQISRDVGIKLSGRLWPPTTHEVDPDVDAARFQLMQDMLASERVARLGFAPGVGAAPRSAPRYNAEHDPYVTDGLRAIFVLTETRTDITAAQLFGERYPISAP
jgi:LssY C-terminus